MPGEADRIRRRVEQAAERAVRIAAEDLLGEAARRAPLDEGTLRASGDVDYGRTAGGTFEATVAFNSIYAARQHEETSWQHPRGGQAKYLESVLMERQARYERVIAAAMEQALR